MARCTDCGFLAIRRGKTRELIEADPGSRTKGGWIEGDPGAYHRNELECFLLKIDIGGQRKERGLKTPLPITEEQRECEDFIRWHPGLSPKEHRQMLIELEARKEADRLRWHDRYWGLFMAMFGAGLAMLTTWLSGGFAKQEQPVIHVYPAPVQVIGSK